MSCLKLSTALGFCVLLGACMPVADPVVAGRADNAIMRFSAIDIVAPLKLPSR